MCRICLLASPDPHCRNMAKLEVRNLGLNGVNVDKDPLELADGELSSGQNAIQDIMAGKSAIRKRPGLLAFNTSAAAGLVLGGTEMPLIDLSVNGNVTIYIARGPLTGV